MSFCYRCGSTISSGNLCPNPWCGKSYVPVVQVEHSASAVRPTVAYPHSDRVATVVGAMMFRAALSSATPLTEEWYRQLAREVCSRLEVQP